MVAAISVVVPVLNAEPTIDELHRRIAATLTSVPELTEWELILVNDGSTDRSWERIVGLSEEHPEVRGLDLTRNFGQHNALLAGIHAARHQVVVTLDDDLQNPPEEVPKLVEALGPDLDVVYGVPIERRQPLHRRIGGAALRSLLVVLTRRRTPLISSGFRAFRSDLAQQPREAPGRRVVLDALLRARTDRIGSVPVNHEARRVGRSNYRLRTLARHALTEIATSLRARGGKARNGPSYGIRAVTGSEPGGDGTVWR